MLQSLQNPSRLHFLHHTFIDQFLLKVLWLLLNHRTMSSHNAEEPLPEQYQSPHEIYPSDLEKSPDSSDSDEFDIPDGGYGWLVVLAIFLINANTWGANSGFSIYLAHYLEYNTFSGGDKYDYALVGGFAFGLGLIFSPLINKLHGMIGTKPTIIIGSCIQFASLMMASFAVSLWQLYLTQGLLNAIGLAMVALPGFGILPQWFKKKRDIASAIAAGGSGVGGTMYNLGMQKVLETRDVFWALRAQSIIIFGLLWIAIFLIRSRMKNSIEVGLYDTQCLKSVGFWILVCYCITCMLGYVIVLYNMAAVTTTLGYSAYQGSIAAAMVQVGSFFGRPLVGLIAQKIGPVTATLLAYILCAIFTFSMWIPARNLPTIYAFCIIMGGLMGTIFATMPPILGKLFGLRKAATAFSMAWIFLGLSGIASPVIGLALKRQIDDPTAYVPCAIFAGCGFTACSLTLLVMRAYLLARIKLAGPLDHDQGHMHIIVPFSEPLKHILDFALV